MTTVEREQLAELLRARVREMADVDDVRMFIAARMLDQVEAEIRHFNGPPARAGPTQETTP